MDAPTGGMVREWATNNIGSGFDFARFGYPEPEDEGIDQLDRIVRSASAWVAAMTGRLLNESLTDPDLVALAQDAVLMRTQQILVGRGTTKAVRDALAGSQIKSMRAGDYSETRRDPIDSRRGGQINPWLELSDAILALATPDRRAELLAEIAGKVRPVAISVPAVLDPPGVSYLDPFG